MNLPTVVEIKHAHLFCGLGGGAKGFNKAQPRVGNMVGKFEYREEPSLAKLEVTQ